MARFLLYRKDRYPYHTQAHQAASSPPYLPLDNDDPISIPTGPEGPVLRQCKRTLSRAEAAAMGWTYVAPSAKHRYCFTIPRDRHHARILRDMLKVGSLPYPKHATMNGVLTVTNY